MGCKHFLLLCVTLCLHLTAISTHAKDGTPVKKIPPTRFTCEGRTSGYYADLELGCRVYHMCDGLGRQFSYTCPNMTLFQQRMLICDHWYMVNCSMSERDYNANLLIGQRDKPFVSDEEMRLRTPRPDVLAAPPFNPYLDILREDDSKYSVHPGNSIVGVADTIPGDKNGLDIAKRNYRPPTGWSTGKKKRRPSIDANIGSNDNLQEAASQEPDPTFQPTPNVKPTSNSDILHVTQPSRELSPPHAPTTTEEATTEDTDLHVTVSEDPVFNFIKRFDPNSPDSHKTAMSKTEIIDLNEHLPSGQVSSEEDRTPRKNKNFGNSFNDFKSDNDKSFPEQTRFDTVNTKANPTDEPDKRNEIPEPEKVLLPPKIDSSPIPTTTVGPPIYYEWKWAGPAIDLEPPKQSNSSDSTNTTVSVQKPRSVGKNPFSSVTRKPEIEQDLKPSNTEYNISSYFVPDYVFPLDSPHPGYENDEAMTSFQVQVARPGRASYGENPSCPQCHPAYLKPGTCEPCIVKR